MGFFPNVKKTIKDNFGSTIKMYNVCPAKQKMVRTGQEECTALFTLTVGSLLF